MRERLVTHDSITNTHTSSHEHPLNIAPIAKRLNEEGRMSVVERALLVYSSSGRGWCIGVVGYEGWGVEFGSRCFLRTFLHYIIALDLSLNI